MATTTGTKWVVEAATSAGEAGLTEGILEKLDENAPEAMGNACFLGSLDGSIGAIFEVESTNAGTAVVKGGTLFLDLLKEQGINAGEIEYLATHRFEEIDILDENEEDPFDEDDDGDEDESV